MNMLNIVSFNDVSERHVRLWPNKCMTFWYVKCAQRVNVPVLTPCLTYQLFSRKCASSDYLILQ